MVAGLHGWAGGRIVVDLVKTVHAGADAVCMREGAAPIR